MLLSETSVPTRPATPCHFQAASCVILVSIRVRCLEGPVSIATLDRQAPDHPSTTAIHINSVVLLRGTIRNTKEFCFRVIVTVQIMDTVFIE